MLGPCVASCPMEHAAREWTSYGDTISWCQLLPHFDAAYLTCYMCRVRNVVTYRRDDPVWGCHRLARRWTTVISSGDSGILVHKTPQKQQ